MPAGRVFFETRVFETEKERSRAVVVAPPARGGRRAELLEAPGGVQVLTRGGLTTKRNDVRNAFGFTLAWGSRVF